MATMDVRTRAAGRGGGEMGERMWAGEALEFMMADRGADRSSARQAFLGGKNIWQWVQARAEQRVARAGHGGAITMIRGRSGARARWALALHPTT